MSEIEFININLWQIVNLKKKESIDELNQIKNCGFLEVEICKFFNNIKDLFSLEVNKYIETINALIGFYMKYFLNEKIATMKISNSLGIGNNQNKLIKLKDEINQNLDKANNEEEQNIIFKDLLPVEEILKNEFEKNKVDINNINDFNDINNTTEYTFSLNKKINSLIINIHTLFFNSIKLMMSKNEQIIAFLKLLSEIYNTFKKKISNKSKKIAILTSDILTSNNSNIQSNNEKSIISQELFQTIIKNEKSKLKYRLYFIKNFAIKYMIIISKIALNIFKNCDEWVIKSISKENESQNEVINLLKTKLNNIEKIDEEIEIDCIEMDSFEKRIDDKEKFNNNNNSNIINDLRLYPIDNTSVINSGIYNKINIDFLVNDNFFDIKLIPIEKNGHNFNSKNENIYENINEIKDYEIIIPRFSYNYNNNNYLMSEKSNVSNEEEVIKEEDFYYDVEKFFDIYKEISEFEEEKNIINYNIFFENFIKYYIINDHEEADK